MAKKETITRITLDEAKKLIADGPCLTDWARVGALTDADIEAAIASDPEEAEIQWDWSNAFPGLPPRKEMVNMRLDREVLDWFRSGGKGYQSRINAVLNSYVRSQTRVRATRPASA